MHMPDKGVVDGMQYIRIGGDDAQVPLPSTAQGALATDIDRPALCGPGSRPANNCVGDVETPARFYEPIVRMRRFGLPKSRELASYQG